LVELLIVIAIMGVLAAVAFSMFAGVLGNSKRRADERTADQIAKAISAYMVDTGDTELTVLKDGAEGEAGVENVIVNLQKELGYGRMRQVILSLRRAPQAIILMPKNMVLI